MKIAVIIGSTRPGRVGRKVAEWYLNQVKDTGQAEVDLIDLAEVNLPFLDEATPPSAGKYEKDHTKKWAETIASYDGFVWVTAEYNHGMPAPLKNAIDYVFAEWHRKPVALVSYGSMGGARAAEQLRQVAGELYMADIRPQVMLREPWNSVSDDGQVNTDYLFGEVKSQFEELLWWAKALKAAREA